jgi:sucrose-6-phosphate hydrolase SacC (GH32 family)
MRRTIAAVMLLTAASTVHAAGTDKTLVSWVSLADRGVTAGSVLTVQLGHRFDGIIYAELSPRRWMAGSDTFSRTQRKQDAFPVETAGGEALIQMAIVYEGDRISIYRDGEPYESHKARNIDLLSGKDSIVVFGLRHVGGNGSIAGSIEDARIFDRALTVAELKSLAPNRESPIKPYAWWDFEGGRAADRAGRFPHSKLEGGAKVAGGRLVLGRGAVMVAAATKEGATVSRRRPPRHAAPSGPFTPSVPADHPDTWLTYHLAHPGPDRARPADPNCAIFHKGRYHLHYIFQNRGHSFAHVSSTDMVHWKWHETTLTPPKTGHGMFSGTAFLTKEGVPAIIYHGQGSRRNQIALALDDDLEKWSETWAVEPKNVDGSPAKMRHWDPDCWLIGDTYYALGGGGNPTLARSTDLKEWEFLGELFHPDFPKDLGVAKGEDTSCANMFRIGDRWMLLCISHGLGCRYYLGDFKDGKYLPDHHAMMNWARWDFFAPESLLTPDGRRVMWAWCTPWVNGMQRVGRSRNFEALMKGRIQPGIQSLPRELSLPADGTLCIRPLRELEKLRFDRKRLTGTRVRSGSSLTLSEIAGDTMELEFVFTSPLPPEFGVKVLCGPGGENGFTVAHGSGHEKLTVGYIEPPFELEEGEDLTLRVFIDRSMIEVFANDRQAAVAWHEYDPGDLHVNLFSKGGVLKLDRVTAWKMKSIYYADPIHFKPKRPTKRTVGDVIPFFWKGEYHVFYLTNPLGNHDVNWEHCSSTDLVNWKEHPPALKPDSDDPTGSEGGCMFTGCVVEKDGVFHAWYTSWNPRNPDGREFLSHGTSTDLITWTKHPEHMIAPDGIHYAAHRMRDFRDPQIFWNADAGEYWMHILANEAKPEERGGGLRFGLLTSKDLVKWEQKPSVALKDTSGDECPDYFRIGDTHYIHGCRRYYYADGINGPYRHPELTRTLDCPPIKAAKRVWDGRRHVWFGGWSGGVMPLPREIHAGPDGLLYMKPVEEVPAAYSNTVLDLARRPKPVGDDTGWRYDGASLKIDARERRSAVAFDAPAHCMLDCLVKLTRETGLSVIVGGEYRMTLTPADGRLSLVGPGFKGGRACPVDTTKPVKIQVFAEGPLVECFVNDQFAQSCVVKGPRKSGLEIVAEGGVAEVQKLLVKTHR